MAEGYVSINVNAGSLRHVVKIQKQAQSTVDGMGAPASTWTDFYTGVRGAFLPLRGDQYFAGQQMASIQDAKWRIRYQANIKAGMRVEWTQESRYFKIVSPPIDPDGRHVYLDLMCQEIQTSKS